MAPQGRAMLALAVALGGAQQAAAEGSTSRANPIRRVVNMLQKMADKVDKAGEEEDKLFEKFFCYCKNGKGQLEVAIADAEAKIPQLESSIEETKGQLEQLGGGVGQAKTDRDDAKKAVGEATSLREKEAAEFATQSTEMKTNIDAMGKAIAAIEKGTGGSFLQSNAATQLRKISINADISSSDRDVLASFLSTDEDSSTAGSGQIVGILKQMKDTMTADLADITTAEEASIKSFDSLVAAKNKEIEALTQAIEDKITRNGEAGVALTNMKEDLDDTSKAMVEDKKFAADLDTNCATKKDEQAERQKMRSEEITAIQETIKILNDDDALELFKKTLPSASLLQLQTTAKETKQRALSALNSHHKKDVRIDLISLALKGKKVSFDKVIGMIDEMVGLLGKEQKDDEAKKEYCESEIDKTEDELKLQKQKGGDIAKATDEAKGAIATLGDEIAALTAGVKDLDKQVAEATETRKEENTECKEVTAANNAAVELLGLAKNRLNKFYNPKLAKAALAQQSADPGAAPEVPSGEYKKSSEESNGVLAMIDGLVAEVEKEVQTMGVEEKNAQEEYETFMKDSSDKRALDLKSVEEKEGAKAEAEGSLQKLSEDAKATLADEMATAEILGGLHKDCDWLLQNFDVRKEARESEVEALGKAKAVLSGADYSLLQTSRKHASTRLRGIRRH